MIMRCLCQLLPSEFLPLGSPVYIRDSLYAFKANTARANPPIKRQPPPSWPISAQVSLYPISITFDIKERLKPKANDFIISSAYTDFFSENTYNKGKWLQKIYLTTIQSEYDLFPLIG